MKTAVSSFAPLLRKWCGAEGEGSPRLATLIEELREEAPEWEHMTRFLEAKELQDRARMAALDRERWHRQLSWRLVRAVFFFGLLSAGAFLMKGGEGIFMPFLFFLGGGTAYYLAAQAVVMLRVRADKGALKRVEARTGEQFAEIAAELDS